MHADEPIADGGRGGRSVHLIQDGSGHFYVTCDGVHTDEVWDRGTTSDAAMRTEGYQPVVEVDPELHECPRALAGVVLDNLYVAVRMPRG